MFWDIKSPFTASPLQVSTYLLGVALFSISFLVFLNSSVSFLITDLLAVRNGVGNAVGTLGFADELLALIACPIWGLLSDRIGVRGVTVVGYAIVGLSLFLFVQAKNIYPQLLLARLFFSVGGAATSTMVTAILPIMTIDKGKSRLDPRADSSFDSHATDEALAHRSRSTTGTSATATPERYSSRASSIRSHPHSITHIPSHDPSAESPSPSANSQIAGLVGMFTGIGALVALGLFLPLPARLREIFEDRGVAVVNSFYVVGFVALLVAVFCYFGLRSLAGEERKGWRRILPSRFISPRENSDGASAHAIIDNTKVQSRKDAFTSFARLGLDATKLGFLDTSIGLGYIGGFVARASSVAISLFIPLYINSYFISTGLCRSGPYDPSNPEAAPGNLKEQCERAYKLAAALTGVSQLIALLCAPIFGWVDGRYRRANLPLIVAAAIGILGYIALARMDDPDPESRNGGAVFAVMAALGISQIGAIVCSLSSLGRGIQKEAEDETILSIKVNSSSNSPETIAEEDEDADTDEQTTLVGSKSAGGRREKPTRAQLKGSIAGIYSLGGGAGILLLTKLGGYLFDRVGHGAPFYLMALFNMVLFAAALGTGLLEEVQKHRATRSIRI